MIQANQQSTTIDTWEYWEFQMYIEILNRKNSQKAEAEKKQRDGLMKAQENSNTSKPKLNMSNFLSKFKR